MLPYKYSEAFETFKEASLHMQRKLESTLCVGEMKEQLKRFEQENALLKQERDAMHLKLLQKRTHIDSNEEESMNLQSYADVID